MVTYTSSFFCENGLFGAWPTQAEVDELENWGVKVFVKLANEKEEIVTPYTTSSASEIITYPITDSSVPEDKEEFMSLVVSMCDRIEKGHKIYIHCKGGHGRAGILVSAILMYKDKVKPEEAIALTSKFHSQRQNMKEKWRRIGSPQTGRQKYFVSTLFSKLK